MCRGAAKSSIIGMNTHPDVIQQLVRDHQAELRREAREYNFASRVRRLRRSRRDNP
jgi:hypothetical protein